MKRTFKYKHHISKWYDVNIGDVLILVGKNGDVFDTVIMKGSDIPNRCGKCPLSKNNTPGECMHYAFACDNDRIAVSINKMMEDL